MLENEPAVQPVPPEKTEPPKGKIKEVWAIVIIAVIALLVAVGIWYWFFRTQQGGETNVQTSHSVSPSSSTGKSASPSSQSTTETKTYNSTSTCISKFSFKYPNDWTIYNDYSVVGQENGGEGGGCLIDVRFLKEDKNNKNVMSPLNTRVRATSNTVVPVNIDDMINWLEGSKTFNELIASSDKTSDVNLGGVNTKMYHLGGMIDWYYIGLVKNNSYYQIELQDPGDDYKNDRGSAEGFQTIVSTWQFL
jgi:hypothetical protein